VDKFSLILNFAFSPATFGQKKKSLRAKVLHEDSFNKSFGLTCDFSQLPLAVFIVEQVALNRHVCKIFNLDLL
jgi:hypothetical protein